MNDNVTHKIKSAWTKAALCDSRIRTPRFSSHYWIMVNCPKCLQRRPKDRSIARMVIVGKPLTPDYFT